MLAYTDILCVDFEYSECCGYYHTLSNYYDTYP